MWSKILDKKPLHLCMVLVLLMSADVISTAFALYGTKSFIELNPLGFELVAFLFLLWAPIALYISAKKENDRRRINTSLLVGIAIRIIVLVWNSAMWLLYFNILF